MRAVAQRVRWARVEVDGAIIGEIALGMLVYLGVGRDDDARDRAWLIDKLVGMRIFPNPEGKMHESVRDVGGALLVVSQFTLHADLSRGRRPSFELAMPPAAAEEAYESFVREAGEAIPVAAGRFGADMLVSSVNEGPVTMLLDSRVR